MTHRILVVEDDPHIAENLEDTLQSAGFSVHVAQDGEQALDEARNVRPDLILLDLGLPDVRGEQVLDHLHRMSDTPVIILSAHDDPQDRNLLLDDGAREYLTKPYRDDDLLARIRLHLKGACPVQVHLPPLEFDLAARRATCHGHPLPLLGTEFDLLLTLAQHPGRILSADELMSRLQLRATPGTRQLVHTQLASIRAALSDAGEPDFLRSVRDYGYGLRTKPQELAHRTPVAGRARSTSPRA